MRPNVQFEVREINQAAEPAVGAFLPKRLFGCIFGELRNSVDFDVVVDRHIFGSSFQSTVGNGRNVARIPVIWVLVSPTIRSDIAANT